MLTVVGDPVGPAGHTEPTVTPRLRRAAEEFEAQMMKELMKPMTAQGSFAGEDAEAGAAGSMGEFAAEALSQAISRQGGFGVAKSIMRSISHSDTVSVAGNGTAARSRKIPINTGQ